MQFAIFFSSLIAATFALPIPQTGVSDSSPNVRCGMRRSLTECSYWQTGSTDVLSGATGGTSELFPGSANNLPGEGGNPVDGFSKSGSGLAGRSPGVGVSMLRPVPRPSLMIITGWFWRCAIRSGGWHQHFDGRRCQQCAQQWWELRFRPFEFQWRSREPRTRACSWSKLNCHGH